MAIFGNKQDAAGTPLREEKQVSTKAAGELHTLLGKGSEFEGKLTFEGQVRIDGKYTGQIQTKDLLVIGEGAKVTAEILAGHIIINGSVEGTIRATTLVELHPPARVKGTIETPAMSMDKGVIFEGTTKMENLAATKAPPPPAAPVK